EDARGAEARFTEENSPKKEGTPCGVPLRSVDLEFSYFFAAFFLPAFLAAFFFVAMEPHLLPWLLVVRRASFRCNGIEYERGEGSCQEEMDLTLAFANHDCAFTIGSSSLGARRAYVP